MSLKEDNITSYFAKQSRLDGKIFPIGIGDDMAMVNLEGFRDKNVLITTDILLDGTHFDLEKCSLAEAGRKAMAASLSDCAAMASVPLCAVAAVTLPKKLSNSNSLKEIYAGLTGIADEFNCPLIGGDITSGDGRFTIAVTMLSTVGNSRPIQRSNAKAGDVICVTGLLGGSLISGRHMDFTPRVKEALRMTEICEINAMMDISDGLSTDLARICNASKVSATIFADKIPLSKAIKDRDDGIEKALNDGEDFELLFTLTKDSYERLVDKWDMATKITAVGEITEGTGVYIKGPEGISEIGPGGYDHLS